MCSDHFCSLTSNIRFLNQQKTHHLWIIWRLGSRRYGQQLVNYCNILGIIFLRDHKGSSIFKEMVLLSKWKEKIIITIVILRRVTTWILHCTWQKWCRSNGVAKSSVSGNGSWVKKVGKPCSITSSTPKIIQVRILNYTIFHPFIKTRKHVKNHVTNLKYM